MSELNYAITLDTFMNDTNNRDVMDFKFMTDLDNLIVMNTSQLINSVSEGIFSGKLIFGVLSRIII